MPTYSPHPTYVSLTEAAFALLQSDRDLLVAECRRLVVDDANLAGLWRALSDFLDHVSAADEQRLMCEATSPTVVTADVQAFALTRRVRPIVRVIDELSPATRLSLVDQLIGAANVDLDQGLPEMARLWRSLADVVLPEQS